MKKNGILLFILIFLTDCSHHESALQIIVDAQGGMENYYHINNISFNSRLLEYDENHLLTDTDSLTHFPDATDKIFPIPCDFKLFANSVFYPFFPFSLASYKSEVIASFQKTDTLDNKVYNVYNLSYTCEKGDIIDHTVYCIYLNNQIRFHIIKMNQQYYRIEPITWQKEGGIIFPLRNKIYKSSITGEKLHLMFDLVYSEIKLDTKNN